MKGIFNLSIVLVILLFSSCATIYHSINPDKINYPAAVKTTEKLDLSYRYDVLRDAGGNKKYMNKEIKNDIRIVAVKLTNNSDSTIFIAKDVLFYCGDTKVKLMSPFEIKSKIQQTWPAYGLYLIGCISLAPLDILVFGGIGAGNMIVAGTSNKKLLTELTEFDITNKEIKKGESIIGLIGFETLHSDPLTVRLTK